MAARISQAGVEILRRVDPPTTRTTRAGAEVLRKLSFPTVRVSVAGMEWLKATQATAAVTQAGVEILIEEMPPPGARVSRAGAEILVVRPRPALVTQAGAEVLRILSQAPIAVTQAGTEILLIRPYPILVTQAGVEILRTSPPTIPPPPPPPSPPALPPEYKPFLIPHDPTVDVRVREHTQQVSEMLNSLQRQGFIRKTGPAQWEVTPSEGLSGTLDGGSFGTMGGSGANEFLTSLRLAGGLIVGGRFKPITSSDLPDSGVTAGTYTLATVTVDATGRVTSASSGSAGATTDPKTAIYPSFTVGANDDEFDDSSFSGWTAVNSGSHNPTLTETNNVLSIAHPGGDAAAELHAWLKNVTPSTGDYIEIAFRGLGVDQNFPLCGLIFADGTTYGSGVQVVFYYSPQEARWSCNRHTGFNALGTLGATSGIQSDTVLGDMFLRLQYSAANSWIGYISPDGVSWINVTGTKSYTLSPTKIGFFVSTWGGSSPHIFSVRYFKHSS